jgi:hypothetical protein
MVGVTTQTGSTARPRGPGRSFLGLLWSLVPVLVLILLLVWWQRGDARPVPTVDPAPDIAYAKRISPTPLPVPGSLPAGWRPTSSRVEAPSGEGRSPVTLSIGYLTPGERFAQLVISDRPVGRVIQDAAPGATADGVAPAGFDRYRTARGEPALVSQRGVVTILVTGDAAIEDLVRLATSVR